MSSLQDVQDTEDCRGKGRMPKRYMIPVVYFLGIQ